MKKSISVNIKGTIFNIEEDAFDSLKKYLDSVKKYFSTYEDSDEIYDDIEARIAEILHEKLSKEKEVITSEDVDNVISTMGQVEDFAQQEEEFQEINEEKAYEPNFTTTSENVNEKKRFYKDGKHKIISGVCSGIGHYFSIDPFWVRLLFVISPFFTIGTGIIIYLLLAIILPENNNLSETKVKKLFRDGDDAVLGGVSSGIAKYFGTDPVWIRIIFVISAFAGFGILTYLIIWIITPEAKTRSEKMQMEGEPITISNIEKNIKENLNLKDKEGNESTLATILLFPFRLLSQILTGIGSLIKPFSMFILQIIRFVGGFGFLAVGLFMMFVFFILLAVGIGLVSGDYVHISSDIPIDVFSTIVPGYGMIAAFFTGFFPSLLFVLLGLSLFSKRMLIKPLVFGAIFGFWIISIGALAGAGAFIAKDYQDEAKISKKEIIEIDNEEIKLELNGNGADIDNVELIIKTTSDTNIRLIQKIESRGSSINDAKENAKNVNYNYTVKNNVITFDEAISFKNDATFKFQDVTLELYIPFGKKIRIDEDLRGFLNTNKTNSYPSIGNRHSSSDIDLTERIWLSEKNKIKCINCDDIISEDDEDDNDTEEENYNFSTNGTSNTYELSDFRKIKITDAFEVKIIQSDEYMVKAIGSEEDLENVNIELNDEWLIADYGGSKNHKIDLDLLDFDDNSRKIKLLIQTPNIEELDISGATVIDMKFSNLPSLDIDISGASKLDLDAENIDNIILEVSGASQVDMSGSTEVFTVELSGASQLNAINLESKIVVADASGASSAKVHAVDKLEAETSGVSTIKYKGNPKLNVDEDDFSNIKKY